MGCLFADPLPGLIAIKAWPASWIQHPGKTVSRTFHPMMQAPSYCSTTWRWAAMFDAYHPRCLCTLISCRPGLPGTRLLEQSGNKEGGCGTEQKVPCPDSLSWTQQAIASLRHKARSPGAVYHISQFSFLQRSDFKLQVYPSIH